MEWIKGNIGSIIVGAAVVALLVCVVVAMVRNRKKNRGACGCGCSSCESCPMNRKE